MFAAMHVKVTLVEGRPRLLPFLDAEIAERLRGAMQALGVDVPPRADDAGRRAASRAAAS